MAAGASKTYTALFQVGGKLLGSFRGAMQMAEMRLKRLRATAASVGGAFRGLGGVIGGFIGSLAGFGVGKVLSSMFSGAIEEAIDAEKRFKTIQVTMLKNAQLMKMAGGDRAKALVLAKEQTDILMKHSDALAEQGVLSDDVYNVMVKQMSIAGVPTKSILHSVDAMGDLLVAINGVTASEGDAAALADAMMKAIFSGKTKGLFPWLGALPKDWWKEQIKQGHGYQDMLDDLLQRMAFAKGTNVAEALTPLGRIQRYNNQLKKMRQEIGFAMLPMQAEMADMWIKALPEMKPAIMFVFKGIMIVMKKLAQLVISYVIPAFKRLQAWWKTQTPAQQKRWLLIGAAIAAVGAALIGLGVALPIIATIITAIAAIATPVGAIVIGILALIAAIGLVYLNWDKVKQMFPATAAVIEHLVEGFKQSFITGFDFIKALWKTVVALFTGDFTGVGEAWKKVWQDMVGLMEWWKTSLIAIAKEVGQAFKDYFLRVFEDIKGIWTWMKGFSWEGIKKSFAAGQAAGAAYAETLSTGQAGGPGGYGAGAGGAGVAGGAGAVAGAAGAAGGAGGAGGGGMPVTVASYGGPTEPGQVIGAYNNRLGPGDVAISPNLYSTFGKPGPDNYVMLDGKRYHVADASFYTPGNPTSNMVEIWGYGNQIKRAGNLAKAYRNGGIAAAGQLAMLGEGGPEAVIPLSGGRRAEGLLNYAASALGMGAPASTTSVSFAPHIVINGNATEAEQRAMDSRLRDLKDDFIKQFERAQRQERRLSYEGGYA